ncbi:MAG: hypothetical protein IKM59_07695 [Oscillospiraceae bacterium]|nr:hypothetical protein [Oscillospiraceae bacterium]
MGGLFAILAIVVLIFAVPNIVDYVSRKNKEKEEAEKARMEREAIENEFYILVQKYVKSELTHTILTHICNGDYKNNLPEEIVVDSNIIRSTLNGRPYSFDFTQRRITPLHNNGSHWQVSANEAMAEAINKLMGGNYSIYEKDGTAHMELKAMYDF